MKLFSILLIPLFLVSCTALCPQQKQAILQDQQSFSLAFDSFQATNQIDRLQKFTTDYPDSIWASRAETIILYSQELDQRKLQVEKLRKAEGQKVLELEQLKKFKQQSTEKIESLKKLNQQLAETIEQLKSSLIQSEKRPK